MGFLEKIAIETSRKLPTVYLLFVVPSPYTCFSSECNTKCMFVVPSPSYPVGRVIWGLLCWGLGFCIVCLFCVVLFVVDGGGARQDFLLIEDLPARFAVITNRGTRA
jgi:hypothetical protein